MSANIVKDFFSGFSQVLNYPPVKEGVKNFACIPTLFGGLIWITDTPFEYISGQINYVAPVYSNENLQRNEKIKRITLTFINTIGDLSFIGSAIATRPCIKCIAFLGGYVSNSLYLEKIFGANTIFASNPWHPRHVISFAPLLGLPLLIKSIYSTVFTSADQLELEDAPFDGSKSIFIPGLLFYNIITSRPVLHWGNQLVSHIIRV